MHPKYLTTLITLIFIISCATAQDKNQTKENKSYFKGSASYLSNSVYNGRQDSVTLPYITPSLTYYNKNGFNIGSSISYLSSTDAHRIDLVSIDAGYDFNISKAVTGSIYASKYFYNKSSTSVQGDTKGLLGGNMTYNSDAINIGADVGVLFSQQSDFFFTPTISHSFVIGEDGNQWNIAPTVVANIGTLNYYKQYFNTVAGRRRNNGGTANLQIKNGKGLLLLDYELSLPITYDGKSWGFYLTPTYAIPQSPVEVTTAGGIPLKTEKLENSFFAEIGFYIKF